MTTQIIITVCVLLLLAYVFDLTFAKTKIPSVILLLALGWCVRQGTILLEIGLPNLSGLLPLFGTIGLILIVLEGSLELDYDSSKIPMIRKSFLMALLPLVAFAFVLAFAFQYYSGMPYKECLVNALPLSVISSAIAIPSAANLPQADKEFVVYETSFSDIIGVVLFNFVALNRDIDAAAFGHFGLQLVSVLAISFAATAGLSLLLSRINHHIKFGPIIILILLIYAVSKVYHLPGLIFIVLFGIFLGNLDEFRHYPLIGRLQPERLKKEVLHFREIAMEAAFLVRALFFILFGFLLETEEVVNMETLPWALVIVAGILAVRGISLLVARLPLLPLLFIAPRGLITILLFLSIAPAQQIPFVNRAMIIQVILCGALAMMLGLMLTKKKETVESSEAGIPLA